MPKKTIDLTGTSGKTYDLDRIEAEKRTNSSKELVIQVVEYGDGESPNPANPAIGQIWLSVRKK
jgi:hypothetical protein